MDLLLNVNPSGFLHEFVAIVLFLKIPIFTCTPTEGSWFDIPHSSLVSLVWSFLDITGYYSNHILTCLSKTTSSSALWTYTFNEFWQPPVFNISKNDKHDEMQPFWYVKNLAQSHLNVSNSVYVSLYPLLKFILNLAKMLESASCQFNLGDVLRGTSTFN